MLLQAWRDVTFLHWPLDPAALRPLVPPAFEVQTAEGSAWISVIAFAMPRIRPGGMPPIPGIASANETHIRTYVRGPDGRAGIWMTSLGIDPLAAAIGGRIPFALPYWWADMDVEREGDVVRYRVRRRLREARFDLDVRAGRPYEDAELSDLDHFLTARWVLYSGLGRVRAAILVEHPRWPLRRALVERLDQTLTRSDGILLPDRAPLAHFSDGVDARLSWPRPFVGPRGR